LTPTVIPTATGKKAPLLTELQIPATVTTLIITALNGQSQKQRSVFSCVAS